MSAAEWDKEEALLRLVFAHMPVRAAYDRNRFPVTETAQ
jgi:hypothetical protein